MGDYLLTVVDSLDTFPMLDDKAGFEQAVREVIERVSFDVDSRVQVFEVTIRMMGGLVRRLVSLRAV
jgi:mannosidase alpha-like ER degradation enhancer 1